MKTPLIVCCLSILALGRLFAVQDIPDFGAPQTVITSDRLEMENKDGVNHFYFKGRVRITGNQLEATCEEMEVITRAGGAAKSGTESQFGAIDKIIALGGVAIRQTGRSAVADRAEIFPDKEYVELVGNVVLTNESGKVSGPRFILKKNERAVMMGDGSSTARPTVTLPALPDLGVSESELLKKEAKDAPKETVVPAKEPVGVAPKESTTPKPKSSRTLKREPRED